MEIIKPEDIQLAKFLGAGGYGEVNSAICISVMLRCWSWALGYLPLEAGRHGVAKLVVIRERVLHSCSSSARSRKAEESLPGTCLHARDVSTGPSCCSSQD